MPLSWEHHGDGTSAAVCPDPDGGYTIYVAHPDGKLTFHGPRWKECRWPAPCPRPQMGESISRPGEDEKCRRCSYSGMVHLDNKKQALQMAEEVQGFLEESDE